MAVFGVMGCTALMVSAFGLQNSINTMLSRQFTDSNSIVSYDMQVVLNGSYDTNVAVPDAGCRFNPQLYESHEYRQHKLRQAP